MERYFVTKGSIVRRIWGSADTLLFIFAGAAAEFALNKAVDWLYFTGRLPADPLERLFSTVTYSRKIIFSETEEALRSIDLLSAIHKSVEENRGMAIPDWAYRDVLFLLIDYSIRSFELLERKLTMSEKQEVFNVFHRVGLRMAIKGLPKNISDWNRMREKHLEQHLVCSPLTLDLYQQYEKHLGKPRYILLRQVQLLLLPVKAANMLPVKPILWIWPFLRIYKVLRFFKVERKIKKTLLPAHYSAQIENLDIEDENK